VVCVLLIMSGIAGVAVGGQSALAGWWLIVVFGVVMLFTFRGWRSRPDARVKRPR